MAVATDPQSLVNAAACYECGGDPGMLSIYMVALLQKILIGLNPLAKTDPQSLMNASACYVGCANPTLLMLALLAQIAQSGLGGGSGGVIAGAFANPNGHVTPANTAQGALYYFTDAGGIGNQVLFQWNTAAQNWTQLI